CLNDNRITFSGHGQPILMHHYNSPSHSGAPTNFSCRFSGRKGLPPPAFTQVPENTALVTILLFNRMVCLKCNTVLLFLSSIGLQVTTNSSPFFNVRTNCRVYFDNTMFTPC